MHDDVKRGRGRPKVFEDVDGEAGNNGSDYTRRSMVNKMYQDAAFKKLKEVRWNLESKDEALKVFGGEVLEQLGRMLLQDKCTDDQFRLVSGIISKELFYKRCTVKEAKLFIQKGRKDEWRHAAYWPEMSIEQWDELEARVKARIDAADAAEK